MARRLIADISWLWAGYAARSLAYLAVIVLLTRSFDPEGFGEISLFIAMGAGVAALAGSWPFFSVTVLAHRGIGIGQVFPPAARLAATGTVVCLLVAIPVAWGVLASSAAVLCVLAIYAVALVSLQGVYGVLQAEERMRDIATVQAAERALTLAMLVGIVLGSTISIRLAEVAIAGSAVVVSLGAYLILIGPGKLHGGGDVLSWRTVLKAIGAMGIVNAASYGVAWIDIYLLAAISPGADVGLYSLAYQIYTVALQLAVLWIVATLPRHARSHSAGIPAAEQLPRKQVLVGVRLWASLVGVGAVVAALALAPVFGEGFAESAAPLMVLLMGASFLAPYLAVVSVLIATKQSALVAKVCIVCVAVNVLVDLALIPPLGVMGPAIATTVQASVSALWLLHRTLGAARVKEIGRAVAPVAISLGVLALDPASAPLLALTAVLSVATALPALRWLRSSDALLFTRGAESPVVP